MNRLNLTLRFCFGVLVCLGVLVFEGRAATVPNGFSDSVFVSGLSSPTAMAFAPDGRLFICQQGGSVRVVKNGALLSAPFVNLTVDSSGERGVLGIAFDPNFTSNQFVYIYYTATTPATHNRISRFTASGDVGTNEVTILELENLTATNHNGGAIHFGADGKLYVAVGDNATRANAQTLNNRLGKILRINSDGSVPTDNPFYADATINNRSIWALGLRNPYTFSFQPGSNRMFINDVGEGTWEEVNDGIAGANYGWSVCEGNCSPSNANYRDPIYAYSHTGGICAITGGAFYNPVTAQFPVAYAGNYFFADFCGGWIKKLDPSNGNSVADFAAGVSAPVDLRVGDDGSLYYLARGTGAVGRIRYVASPTAAGTTVGGRVTEASGRGIRNAQVKMLDSMGVERTATTDGQGNYQFADVPSGQVYFFSVAHLRYQFAEPTQVQFIGEDVSGINFTGTSFTRFGDLWMVRNPLSKEPE